MSSRGPLEIRKSIVSLLLLYGTSGLVPAARAEEPGPKLILQQAIEAVGGTARLAVLQAPMMWMERGTFYGMGSGIPFVRQYAARWPDWYRQEVENAFVITVSGNKAWVSSDSGVQLLAGDRWKEQLLQVRAAWAERLFPLTSADYVLSKIEGIPVAGRATVGFRASHPSHRDIKFYFDAETYLIAKIETMVVSPQSGPDPVPSEAYYADHQSFSGVKMPAKFKLFYGGKLFVEGEVVDYKMGATLDPQQFQAPE